MQNVSASVVSGALETEEVYRAKIFDSLRSLFLVLLARPLHSLEYKEGREGKSPEKGEVY